MITVLLADDEAVVRELLRLVLESADDIEILGMASNGREAVEQAAFYFPDVVLMDLSMPVMDGIEATKQIRANHPETCVLIVSMYDNPNSIEHCIQAGAVGYVLKDEAGDELVTAIRSIHNDHRYFSKRIAEMAQRFLFNRGTPDAPSSSSSVM